MTDAGVVVITVPQGTTIVRLLDSEIVRTSNNEIERTWRWYFTPTNSKTRYLVYETGVFTTVPIELHNVSRRHDGVYELFEEANTRYDEQPTQKLYSVRVNIKHLYELYFCSVGDNFRLHAPPAVSSLSLRWMHYRVANDQARIVGMNDLLLELIHCSTRPNQLIMNNKALTQRLLGMRYDHTKKRWFWKNHLQTVMFFDSDGSPPNEQLLLNAVKSDWNALFQELSFPATAKEEEISANVLPELYRHYVRPEAILLPTKSSKYLDLNSVNAKQHAGLYAFETRNNASDTWTTSALFELHIIDAHALLPLTTGTADTSNGQTPISFVTFELFPGASGLLKLDGEPKVLHSSQNSVRWYVAPITPTNTALPTIDNLKDAKVLMASTTREMLPFGAHKKSLTIDARQLLDTMNLLFNNQLGSKKEINFVILAFEQTAHERLISGDLISAQDTDGRPLDEQMKQLNDSVVSGMRMANTVFDHAHQPPLAIGAYQNNFVRLRNLIAIYCINVVYDKQKQQPPTSTVALAKPVLPPTVKMLDSDERRFEQMLYERVILECQPETLACGNTQLRTVIARLLNSRTNAIRFLQRAMILDRQTDLQAQLKILRDASRWTLATRYDLYDLVNDTDGVFFVHSQSVWLGIAPGLYEQIAFFSSDPDEALTMEAIAWMREVITAEFEYVGHDWTADPDQVTGRVLQLLGRTDRRGSILRRALDVAEKEDRFLAEQRNKRTLSNWAFSNSTAIGGGAPKLYTTRFKTLLDEWSHSKNETTKRIASYIEQQLDTVLAILVKYNSLPGMENRMRLRSPSDIQSAKDNFTLDQLMTAMTSLRRAKRLDRRELEAVAAIASLPDSLFPVSLQANRLDRVYPTLDNQMIIGLLAPIYRYRSMDSKCLSTLEKSDTQDNFIVRRIALADKEQLRFYWMTWFARYGTSILPVGDRRSFFDTPNIYQQVETDAAAKRVRSGVNILRAIYTRFERIVADGEIVDTEQFLSVQMGIVTGVHPTVWRPGRKPLVESSLEELFEASLGGFICTEDIPNQSLRRMIMTRRNIMYSMPLDTPQDQLPKHTQAQVLELRKMVAYQMWSDEQLLLIESWFERAQESENLSVIFSLSSSSKMPTLERTLDYYMQNKLLSSPRVQGVSLEKAVRPLDHSMRDLSRPLHANNTSDEWKLLALQKQLGLWPDLKDNVMRFRVERLSAALVVTLQLQLEDAGRSIEAADQAIEEAIDALKNQYAALLRQIVSYENDQKWENQILALKQHYDTEMQRLKTLAVSALQVFKKALSGYENETTRLITLFGVTYLDRDVTKPMLSLHDDRFVSVLTKAKARASPALASDIAQAIDESTTALLTTIKPVSGPLRKSILEEYLHSPPNTVDTDANRQQRLFALTERHYSQWLNHDTHYGRVLEQLMQRLAKEERQLLIGGDRLDVSDRLALMKDLYSRTMIALGHTPQDGKSEEDYLRLIQSDLLEKAPDDRKVAVNRLWSVYATLLDLVKEPAQMPNNDFVSAFVSMLNTTQPLQMALATVSAKLNNKVVPLLLEKALYNRKYSKHLRYAAAVSNDKGSLSFGRALMQRNAHLVLALLLAVSKVRASSLSLVDQDIIIIGKLTPVRDLLARRNENEDLEQTVIQPTVKTNFGSLQSYLDGTIANEDFAVLLSDVITNTLKQLFQSFYNTPLLTIMDVVRNLPLTDKMKTGWTRHKDINVWQTQFFRPLPTDCDLTIAAVNTFLGMEPDSSRDRTAISRLLWSKRMEELKRKQLTPDEDNTLCPRPSEKDAAAKESVAVAEMLCPRTMRDLALACVRWAMDDFYRTGPNCVDRLPKQLFERLLMSLFESAEFLGMRKRYGLDTHMFDVHPYRTRGTIVSPFYRMRPVAHREAGAHYVYVNEALALRLLNELLQRKQHSLDRLQKLASARYRIESDTVHELWRLVLFGYTSDTYVVVEQDIADVGYFPLYTDDAELLANFICDLDEAIQKAATAIGEKALINYDAMSLIQSVFVFLLSFIGSHRTENDIFLQQMHEDGRVLFDYFSPRGIIQLLRDPSTYGLDMVPRALDRHWVNEFVYHARPMMFEMGASSPQDLELASRSAFSQVLVPYVFQSDLRPNVVRVLARYERLQDPYDTRSDLASGSGMCFICESDQKSPWFDVSPLARLDVFPVQDGRAIEFPEGRDGSYHPDRSPFPIDQDHSFYEWRIGRQYYLRPELAQNNVINPKKDTQYSDGTATLVEKLLMLGSGTRHLWPEFFVENNWFLQWYEEWIRLVSNSGGATSPPKSFLDTLRDNARWSEGKSATEWSVLPEVIKDRKEKLLADLDKRFQDAKRSIYYETEDSTITYEGALSAFKLVLGTVNRFSIQEQLKTIKEQFTEKRSEINLDTEHLDERKYRSLETLVDQFERGAKNYNERLAEMGPVLNKRLADVEWRTEEPGDDSYRNLWESLTEDPLVETH